jgi:DnaK suppressor protein
MHLGIRIVVACALTAACSPALAETKPTTAAPAAKPAPAPVVRPAPAPVVRSAPAPAPVVRAATPSPVAVARPSAAQQLSTANQGTAARNHVFDGTKAPPGAVTANTGSKPSVVGTPVSQFKPTVRVTPSAPPPAPPRNLNPTGDKAVQKGIDSYKKPGT